MSVSKAKAAMTANQQAPATNVEAMRQGFFDQCRVFGTNAGAGDTSKVGMFQAIVEASWNGFIEPAVRRRKGDIDTPRSDSENAWDTFAEARKLKAGEMGRKIAGKDSEDRATRVSEVNRMILLGALPHIHGNDMGGLGVFQRTLNIIRTTDEIAGQVDKMLLDVARRQCDLPETPLTDQQIKDILVPEEEGEKDTQKVEVEEWGKILKRIEGLMNIHFPDTAGEDPDAKTARSSVAHRIDELGGTKAMVKARAEAAAKRQVTRQGARKGGKRK